jgi:hypothetical protein
MKTRRMRWTGHIRISHMGDAYGTSVGRPEKKRPLRRATHRRGDSTELELRETKWGRGVHDSSGSG